ncbi:MAG: ABC transporter ATP-binding protein [Acidimicrobiales bacterium]
MLALSDDANDVFVLYEAAHGDVAALRGLSLTVDEGQTVAVIGPSGAGKSTLLDLCATQRRPSSGQFTVLGTALDTASARQLDRLRRTQIGIVRQHYDRALPGELTVTEIVALPLRLAGRYSPQSGEWLDQLLTAAGLHHRAHAHPDELSGGEQQRVAVCAAVVTRPRLLLADEPTGELDPRTSAELLDSMLHLTRTVGATALLVSHDQPHRRPRAPQRGRDHHLRRIDTLTSTQAAALRRDTLDYLSQHSTLVDHLSVKENIELGLALRGTHPGDAGRRATTWLQWIGLSGYAARRADQLSGGEQRRVALARALAPQPALLLADEPTAHLDQLSARLVIRLLQAAVNDNGTTVIAATHDPDFIAADDSVLRIDSPIADAGGTPQSSARLLP